MARGKFRHEERKREVFEEQPILKAQQRPDAPAAAPNKTNVLRALLRVFFGLNCMLLGWIQMVPPLAEPFTGDHPLTIAFGVFFIYIGWLFVTNRHGRWFKAPF
jgi:hypothetical protein